MPSTHDLLVQAIMDYYNMNERFEAKGFDENGRKVRSILSDIRRLCTQRRVEVQDKRKQLKANKQAQKQDQENQA